MKDQLREIIKCTRYVSIAEAQERARQLLGTANRVRFMPQGNHETWLLRFDRRDDEEILLPVLAADAGGEVVPRPLPA